MFDMKTRSGVLPCCGDIGSDNRLPTSKRSHIILHNFALYSLWVSKPLLLRSRIIFADSKMIEVIKSPPPPTLIAFSRTFIRIKSSSKPGSAEEHEMNENAESELCFLVWYLSKNFPDFWVWAQHYIRIITYIIVLYINVLTENFSSTVYNRPIGKYHKDSQVRFCIAYYLKYTMKNFSLWPTQLLLIYLWPNIHYFKTI